MTVPKSISAALPLLLAGCVCLPGSWVALPCCGDGAGSQISSLNTGSAPWRVWGPTSTAFQAVAGASDAAWTSLAPANWVGPPNSPVDAGDYIYELPFNVLPCPGQGGIQLTGEFAADNRAQVYVDGGANPIATSLGTVNYGFLPASVTPFTAFIPYAASGTHTLKIVVTNTSDVTGLIVRGNITRHCKTRTTDSTNPD